MKKIKGIGKLPPWVQRNTQQRFINNASVKRLEIMRVAKDENFQPGLFDTIRVIGWGGGTKSAPHHAIVDVAEYKIGLPTVEEFWVAYTA